uniref:Uncharacterized protein MANES_01G145400 n=1 Tax=Rhizophora mucronata TaxID=61149 RepID=A0A2P2JTE2_RHIMU
MDSPPILDAAATTDPDGARNEDPFLLRYQPSDLRIASEFLTNWLPFLSRDLCHRCTQTLSDRIRSLDPESDGKAGPSHRDKIVVPSIGNRVELQENCCDYNCDKNSTGSCIDGDDANSLGSWKDGGNGGSEPIPEPSTRGILAQYPSNWTPSPRMSWADMAQEDELIEEEDQRDPSKRIVNVSALTGELMVSKVVERPKLTREQREYIRFMNVERKRDFICLERVKGKIVNVLEGLELHTGIFSTAEQKRIVDYVYSLQEMGKRGELKERTYTAPQKWMRGKGRVTIQFGCCYNYAIVSSSGPHYFTLPAH